MTTKRFATFALTVGLALSSAAPSLAHDRSHERDRRHSSERYVPAGGNLIDMLFGGPRYYDKQMSTTGSGPCAYDRVGPDANAVNDINDHYCGK